VKPHIPNAFQKRGARFLPWQRFFLVFGNYAFEPSPEHQLSWLEFSCFSIDPPSKQQNGTFNQTTATFRRPTYRGLTVRRNIYFMNRLVQTSSAVHSVSCLTITGVLSLGVKRPRCETEHLPPYVAKDEKGWSCSSNPPQSVTVLSLTIYSFLTQPFKYIIQHHTKTPQRNVWIYK